MAPALITHEYNSSKLQRRLVERGSNWFGTSDAARTRKIKMASRLTRGGFTEAKEFFAGEAVSLGDVERNRIAIARSRVHPPQGI
jgi:hypothetical protein